MKRFLTRQLYLLAIGGSVLAFCMGIVFGGPLEAIVLGSSVLTLAIGVFLEHVAPFDSNWNRSADDTRTDVTSALVLIGLVDPLVKAILPVAVVSLLADSANTEWRLSSVPFALQVLVVLLWIEFSKYWSHRAHHEFRSLWWLHALHHSSERLYWLNNFRFHPLNHILNTLVSLLPLLVLGAPADVLLAAVAVTQPVTMLQHTNIGSRNGWLNYIFSTNELHRWHHSAEPGEANSNFGSALVLWDQVFGTFRVAPENRPTKIGLFGDGGGYPARASYRHQLFSMFTPTCCRA